MEFTIEPATIDDTYEYASVHIASWKSAYKGIVTDEYLNGLNIAERSEKLRNNFINRPQTKYLKAMIDEKIIGVLILECSENSGEVCAIYLLAEYWHAGFGTKMMNFAADYFKKNQCANMFLWALEDNWNARKFYEHYGFVFSGEIQQINISTLLKEVKYVMAL